MHNKCNKCVQTDISFFSKSEIGIQTYETDLSQDNYQPTIKQQYDSLNNIFPNDITLIYNNKNGIHFTVKLSSSLTEEQQCSQILLNIKGPLFIIEVDFLSSFSEEEKYEIQQIINKTNRCNLLETIFQLEAKLIELDKEFANRKEQIQYHYTLARSLQNIDYEITLQKNVSKNLADQPDENSKSEMRNSAIGVDQIKDQLIEKYDNSEPQFNPAPAPTVQLAQLSVCSQSRFNFDFCEIELIGTGGFGKVFKSRNRFDGNYYALKRIALDCSNAKLTEKTKNEAVLLARIQHPNIVRYYQAWTEEYVKDQYEKDEDEDDDDEYNESEEESETEEEQLNLNLRKGSSCDEVFEDDEADFDNYYEQEEEIQVNWVNDNQVEEEIEDETMGITVKNKEIKQQKQLLYIQMEYCTGDTLKKKIDERSLNSEQKKKIIRQILDALCYLHKNNIIHRDLKPQNIFLDGNLNVKLGDFGLATEMKQEIKQIDTKIMRNSIQNTSLTQGVGTRLYLAPEQEQSQYDAKVDVYSLGIILFEMYYPYKTDMERINYINQLRTQGILPKDFVNKVAKVDLEIRDKIQSLVLKDPKKRPTTGDLLNEYKDKRVQQVIRSIANPNCPDFSELVSTLFECKQLKQTQNLLTSCLEEALTKSPEMFIKDFQKNLNDLYNRVENIFKQRGSIKLNLSPLISPENYLRYQTLGGYIEEYENSQHIDQSFRFITEDGGIVQFCQNLLQPTIYWLKMLPLNNFRRYSFGEVQHAHRQTFSKQCCATYDILQDTPIYQQHLVELLSISRDVINQFTDPYNFELKISHTQLFELIILELGFNYQMIIRLQSHSTFLYNLIGQTKGQHSKNSQTYRELYEILTQEFNFSDDKAAKLLQFLQLKQHFLITKNDQQQKKVDKFEMGKKNLDQKLKRTFGDLVKPYFTKYQHQLLTILKEIQTFIETATDTKILGDIRIVLEVFQSNELTCYYSGITFEVVSIVKEQRSYKFQEADIIPAKTDPTKKEVKKHLRSNYTSYIIGGDYSHYLRSQDQNNHKYGCGIQIYLDQIYFNKFTRYLNDQPGRFQTFTPLQMYFPIPEIRSMQVTALILTEVGTLKEAFILAQYIWNMKSSAIVILIDKGSKNIASAYTKEFQIRVKAQDKFCIKRTNLKEEERTLLSTLKEIEISLSQQKYPQIQHTQSTETKSVNSSKPNNESLKQDTKPSSMNRKEGSKQARKISQRPNQQKRRGQSSIDNQ